MKKAAAKLDQVCKPNRRLRIGFIYPYTGGNLGDSSIIDASRHQLLQLFPDAEILLIVMNHEHVSRLHDSGTFPLGVLRKRFYCAPAHCTTWATSISEGSRPNATGTGYYAKHRSLLKGFLHRFPPAIQTARFARDNLLSAEARHIMAAHRLVRSLDALVAAGGGQFDDEYGGPWGHPYSMFKWVKLAALNRRPVYFVGVGVCEILHPLTVWLLRCTLSRVRRVSVRDGGSISIFRQLSIRGDFTTCPDLAFGLKPTKGRKSRIPQGNSGPRLTIGVSPIAFAKPGVWPRPDVLLFERYWSELVTLTEGLLTSGYALKLFATDDVDYDLCDELHQRLIGRMIHGRQLELFPKTRPPELFEVLSTCDAVIASRLHGVILSHVHGVPVLAISYQRKVQAHMEDMDQHRFCFDIKTFRADAVRRSLDEMLADRTDNREKIESLCRTRHAAVEKEWEAVAQDLASLTRPFVVASPNYIKSAS